MKHTNKLIVGASVGALLNISVLGTAGAKSPDDQSSAAMAQELKQLQDQVDALKKRLDAQAAAEQQTKAAADAAAAQAASAKADTAAIPAQVQSAVAAAKPKTDKIYYKGVTLTLGGFGAAETVFRNHNESADITSGFSAIPYGNSAPGQTNELRFTARQSRITALAEGSPNDTTHLSFYGELDFLGAAQTANSNESNSYNPRIRVLYTNVDWDDLGLHLLTGQSWSLVTLNSKGIAPRTEVLPPVIDAQYVPGFNWARQPQIRITKDFDKTLWLGLSLENPQTTFYTGATALPKSVILTYNETGGSGFNSANTLSLNHIPDIIAKVAYDAALPDRTLHAEAYGLYRSFYERLDYSNQNTSGGGFGAGLIVPVVPKLLDFQVSALAGKGIGALRQRAAHRRDVRSGRQHSPDQRSRRARRLDAACDAATGRLSVRGSRKGKRAGLLSDVRNGRGDRLRLWQPALFEQRLRDRDLHGQLRRQHPAHPARHGRFLVQALRRQLRPLPVGHAVLAYRT